LEDSLASSVFVGAPMAIVAVDRTGRVRNHNPAAQQLFGAVLDDPSLSIDALFEGFNLDDVATPEAAQAFNGRRDPSGQAPIWQARRADGEDAFVEIQATGEKRGFTRAVAKGVLQNELQKRGGLIGGLIGAAASVATEQADDRMWRMLPGRVYVARGYLPPGEHTISINGRPLSQPIQIEGQYALVPLRIYHNGFLTGKVASIGQLATVAAAPAPAPEKSTVVETATPAKKTPQARPARTPRPAAKPAAVPKPVAQ